MNIFLYFIQKESWFTSYSCSTLEASEHQSIMSLNSSKLRTPSPFTSKLLHTSWLPQSAQHPLQALWSNTPTPIHLVHPNGLSKLLHPLPPSTPQIPPTPPTHLRLSQLPPPLLGPPPLAAPPLSTPLSVEAPKERVSHHHLHQNAWQDVHTHCN